MKNHNNKYTEIKNKKQSWWPYKKSIFQKKTNHKPQFLYNPILNDEIENKIKNNNNKWFRSIQVSIQNLQLEF